MLMDNFDRCSAPRGAVIGCNRASGVGMVQDSFVWVCIIDNRRQLRAGNWATDKRRCRHYG